MWIYFASSEESRPSVGPVRFSLNPRGFVYGISHAKGISRGLYERAAVSPDGSRLAFVAVDENGATHIWVRSFTHSDSTRLEGTNGAGRVFWSPDGDRIAFRARGGLFAVPSAGGPVQRIAENLSGAGGSWGRQGVILLGAVDGVWRVDATGGELTRLFEREEFGFWPSFLPDGEHFLYLSEIERGTGHGADNLGIHVASIAEPSQRRLLLPVSSRALYSDGYFLYVNESALMAQPFDVDTLSLAGEGAVLADRLDYFESYGGSTVSAAAGRLIYVTRMPPKALRWVDRKGESRGSLGEPESYADVTSISPGGTHAVGAVRSPRLGTHDLLLFDLERGTSTRLTTEETWESYPVWSPDGRRIAYASRFLGSTRPLRPRSRRRRHKETSLGDA